MKRNQHTEPQWKAKYPNEPFDLPLDVESIKSLYPQAFDHTPAFSYDIVSAAMRQRSFYYQVSLPHYRNPQFLISSLTRYKMYLNLKKVNPGEFIVPCYDIDLIWHTHQVHHLLYEKDTVKILGKILPHDDSVNDRSEGSRLNNAYAETVKMWNKEYQVSS